MNDRDCKKCVHHTAGFCSKWECHGTVTIADVKTEARKELVDRMKSLDDYDSVSHTEFSHGYHRAVEHMIAENERLMNTE